MTKARQNGSREAAERSYSDAAQRAVLKNSIDDVAVRAEKAVLGSIICDPKLWPQTENVAACDFLLTTHQKVFGRMARLFEEGNVNAANIFDRLSADGDVDTTYLSELVDDARRDICASAAKIREAADRRRAAELIDRAQQAASDPTISSETLTAMGEHIAQTATASGSPPYSESDLAERFSLRHRDDSRYVANWSRWFLYDGKRWHEDAKLSTFDRARDICRRASSEVAGREAKKIASSATVAAVERLARSDKRHASGVEQWDSDRWLLNTPTGTVNLRTGELRHHRREDYITKITAAGPSVQPCPLWVAFLQRITAGDAELQAFLQRMVGYCLTGSTREHAMFFLYGTGANGKSVFLTTIRNLLGEYARTAPAAAFTASTTEQHPTDVASLRGARLVNANETESGSRWAESKIKYLTGGDKVPARFMRCDFFEYVPEFKLLIAGNHRPGLRSVDEAIRRRLHMVPFTVTIPPSKRDTSLAEKLRAEFSGIMQWAVEGCLAWQSHGLKPPSAVRAETETYLADEDRIGQWVEDRCVIGKQYWSSSSALFTSWKQWCECAGEREGSQREFSMRLEGHGFNQSRKRDARGFVGIALASDDVTLVTDRPVLDVSRTRA